MKKNEKLYKIIIIFVISVLFEIFICNFTFFKSLFYKPYIVPDSDIVTNMDLEKGKTVEDSYIEILNINKKINNIYIDINYPEEYILDINATDKGNKLYFSLPSRQVTNSVKKSKYINFNLSGKSKKLKLKFSFLENENITVNKIVINSNVPMMFNVIRCVLVFSILLFVYLFRSKSVLYKINLNSYKFKKQLLILIIVFNILIFSIIGIKSLFSYNDHDKPVFYGDLADMVIKGEVSLKDNLNNSEKLLNKMDNPYDTKLRDKLIVNDKQKNYLWDYAFYKGKYYVYFGVVPAVLFFVPYKLLFNSYLSIHFLIYLCIIFTVIGISLLLYQMINKYYKDCSVGVFILLDFLLTYCIGLIYLMKFANSYILPVVCSLMFTVFGLILLCGILKSDKYIKLKLFFGTLCLALVAGCRPNLLVGSFLVIPILYAFYKENKNKIKKEDFIKYFIVFSIPYILVAVGLMYYNYIRFGSVFDFGSNYNLTYSDLTARGFDISRIPLGVWQYLFNPVNFINVFPFITSVPIVTNYMGATTFEPMYGGVFFTTLIFSVCLFLPKLKKIINNKMIYGTCWLMVILGFIVVILDLEMGGILPRYMADFTWLFAFTSVLILLSIENYKFKYKDIFHKVLFVLIFLALIYQFLSMFVEVYLPFYLYVKYLIEFWI